MDVWCLVIYLLIRHCHQAAFAMRLTSFIPFWQRFLVLQQLLLFCSSWLAAIANTERAYSCWICVETQRCQNGFCGITTPRPSTRNDQYRLHLDLCTPQWRSQLSRLAYFKFTSKRIYLYILLRSQIQMSDVSFALHNEYYIGKCKPVI